MNTTGRHLPENPYTDETDTEQPDDSGKKETEPEAESEEIRQAKKQELQFGNISDSGSITIHGETIGDMNEKSLTLYRRKHLGYIFQMYNLIPNLNIKENIEVGAYLSDSPLDVDDLLKTLGLYEHRHKLPNQLSGGQQQRTAIGRAIVKNPDILLCDEPTGALDYSTSKDILKLIEDVSRKYGNTVVMVTHNDALQNMADRVVKLRDGKIRKNFVNETKIPAAELEW